MGATNGAEVLASARWRLRPVCASIDVDIATSRCSVLNRPSPVDAGFVIHSTGLALAARLGVRSWAGLRRRGVGERIAGGLAALASAEGGGEYEQPLPVGGVPTAAKLP
jgi:hypothetical protein